jgi:MoxR-like ATPase
LDELNSAPPAVQAAAYQLILNKRVGTYKLPAGVDIVAAGNRDGDRGVTYRMPAPLANRFVHLEAKVDFDDWQDWATLNKVHPEVVGYVGFAKQDLYDYDPKSSLRHLQLHALGVSYQTCWVMMTATQTHYTT